MAMSEIDRQLLSEAHAYMARAKAESERDAALEEADKLERRAFELRFAHASKSGGPVCLGRYQTGSGEQFVTVASSYSPEPAEGRSGDGEHRVTDDLTANVVARMRAARGPATSAMSDDGDVTRAAMQQRRAGLGEPSPHHLEGNDLAARSDGSDSFIVCAELGAKLQGAAQATADQRARFDAYRRAQNARRQRARDDGSPIALTVVGDQAKVSVHGMLTEVPDLWAWILGEPNTLYSDIADAIAAAERNSSVRHVTFDIESGGGTVAGLRTATHAIRGMKKSRSVLSSFAASAAYWVAAEVGRIEAKHDLAEFGSIGVAVRSVKSPIVHDIASTDAPNKRPDPTTEAGKAAIRKELDAIHAVFARDVAAGRSRALGRMITVDQVNGTFGGGGMLLAGEALKRGVIDGIRA